MELGPGLSGKQIKKQIFAGHLIRIFEKMKKPTPILLVATCYFLLTTLYQDTYGQRKPRYYGAGTVSPRQPLKLQPYNLDSFYQKKAWISEKGDTLRYRLLLPENYDSSKAYPLLVFLHGAGERGVDNARQLVHGGQFFLQPQIRSRYPAIIVFPQCGENDFWSNVEVKWDDSAHQRKFSFPEAGEPTRAMGKLLGWLPDLEKDFKINRGQRYVMGLSMGGMGTFELVRRKPAYFVAAVPICGGANPKTASKIKETAFWIFHGANDDVVPYQLSEEVFLAIQDYYVHEEVRFTLYSGTGHNSWDPTFAEPDLMPWLFSHKK